MWTTILSLLANLFGAIPEIIKLFTKTSAEREEEARKKVDEQEKKFDETGRPQ